MKRTQRIELLASILHSPVLFISMVMVSCLGALCFCGFSFCKQGLVNMGREFYDGANFYDLTAVSPLGMTKDDLGVIKSVEHVKAADIEYSVDALFDTRDGRSVGRFYSQPDGINTPVLLSGHKPEKENECVIESALSALYEVEIGDSITLSDETDGLSVGNFTVVGIMESPLVFRKADYNNRGASKIGDGRISALIWVDISAFDNIDNADSRLYIRMESDRERFTEPYDDALSSLEAEIKRLGLKLETEKYSDRQSEIDGDFSDARNLIDTLQASLDYLVDNDGDESNIFDTEQALSDAHMALTALEKRETLVHERGWIVSASDSNPSFYHFSITYSGMDSVLYTCSGLFLLISALVCYTTIGRLVSQQLRLIGIQKALGLSRREITAKYVAYAVLSSGIGAIVGIILSYLWFAGLIFKLSYGNSYLVNDYIRVFRLLPSICIIFLETMCSLLAALGACHRLIARRTILLMNGSAEGVGKAPHYERFAAFKHIRLRTRVRIRNIITDRRLFVTTQVGVIGCTLLLVAFLTVRSCMAEMPNRQYYQLQNYDLTVFADPSCTTDELDSLEQTMFGYTDAEILKVSESASTFEIDGTYHFITVLCCEGDTLEPFVSLLDGEQNRLSVPSEGVLLCDLTANEYGYEIGDEFLLCDSFGNGCKTFVAGHFERHLGPAIAINADYYRTLTGMDAEFYQYYVKLGDTNEGDFRRDVSECEAFVSLTDSSRHIEETEGRIKAMDKALLVILFLTLALSVFVLFNLEVMHITHKETELTVMKALGFTTRELRSYIESEFLMMSIIGIAAGIPLGAVTGLFISTATQISGTQNVTRIYPLPCIIGGLTAFTFVAISNVIALRRIKKLSLTSVSRG